jgi:hypothetical protein
VLQITISGADKATRRYDLHQLRLPSGRMAHQLGGPDLFHELRDLNVPGILPTDGWQQLALAFAEYLETAKNGDAA